MKPRPHALKPKLPLAPALAPTLKVELLATDALRPNPGNARNHTDDQIERIARSIQTFGFLIPILINRQKKIIAGHGRWHAAGKLGLAKVPTICADHLSQVQLEAFAIADNRLTDLSDWDSKALARQLDELSKQNLDFSIEATGFSLAEIDICIQSTVDAFGPVADVADELPEESMIEPVSRLGDLWTLGKNRVLCGDATLVASFARLLGDLKAHIAFTDHPFNVRIKGHVSRKKHREFAMASGEMKGPQFLRFLEISTKLMAEHSVPGSVHFLCMDWRHAAEMLGAIDASYGALMNICVWVKTNGGMGSLYRSQHELVFVAKNGTGTHRNNIQLGRFGRNRTNIWTYAGPNNFGRSGPEGNLAALHPTVKPVALIADAIMDASVRGDIVLDPFLGSGSTVIAAERTGRRAFGIEIDPLYVDTIIRRWERFTGQTARHANGNSFAQVASKRGVAHD